MQIKQRIRLCGMRRILSGSRLCVRRHGNIVQVYEPSTPSNPDTEQQRAVRAALAECAARWQLMSPVQREQWNSAAAQHLQAFPGATGNFSGYLLFCHCARNLMLVGAPAPMLPSLRRRPATIRNATLLPTTDPRAFAFVLEHGIQPGRCAEYRVAASISAPTLRLSCAPHTKYRRLICGQAPASARVLEPSGQAVIFENARIAVPVGSRFGAWLRVIRLPDGLDSGETCFDLVRTGEKLPTCAPRG